MKSLLIFCALTANLFAAQPVLVRVNAQTLADLLARDPAIRVVNSNTSASTASAQALLNNATILHDGKNWTVVPTGALVHLPANLKGRVNAKPVGTLLRWDDFLTKNREWISTSEVTFDQAAGSEAVSADCAESWEKQDKLIVAVHHDGPTPVRIDTALPNLASR